MNTPATSNTAYEQLRIDPADGNAYNLHSFIQQYGGDIHHPPRQWESATPQHLSLPWGDSFQGPSTIFRQSPPKLQYPSGSIDEGINLHFVRSALGYLRSSTYVRDIIDWDPRPHPFYHYQPLKDLAATQGYTNYQFDPTKTLQTLNWVQNIAPSFATHLREIYNFGGVLSYSNINEQIYHVVYGWLNHKTVGGDIHLLSGIDASDGVFDGITLLRVVIESLQIVRSRDVALQAQRFSRMISSATFIMRPGGMQAYLGEVDKHRIGLININKPLSDAEILGRVKQTLHGKHAQIDRTFRDM